MEVSVHEALPQGGEAVNLTSNRHCLMQTKPDPKPPSVMDKDGKLQPRWKARVIGFEPGVPIEFPYGDEELAGAWCLGGGPDLRFVRG